MKFKKTALTVALSLGLVAVATNASAVTNYVDNIPSPINIPGTYTGGHDHFDGAGVSFIDTVNFTVTDLFSVGGQISNTFNIGGLDLNLNSVTLSYTNGTASTADDVLIATLGGDLKSRSGSGTFTFPGAFYYTIDGTTVGSAGGTYSYQVNTLPVPEPETYAMLLVGLGLMTTIARRRKS